MPDLIGVMPDLIGHLSFRSHQHQNKRLIEIPCPYRPTSRDGIGTLGQRR